MLLPSALSALTEGWGSSEKTTNDNRETGQPLISDQDSTTLSHHFGCAFIAIIVLGDIEGLLSFKILSA